MSDDPTPEPFPPEPRPLTFGDVLHLATPRAVVTWVFLGANVLVFALMVVRGLDPGSPGALELYDWGANFGPAVRDGQVWRLLTSMFLHGGAFHLAMNMYGLYAIGPLTERVYGNVAFAVLYLVAGLFGSLASAATHDVVSVGASGALFGILGGLLAFLLRRGRSSVPPRVLRGLTMNVLGVVALNVALGFSIGAIDNAAHLGGLASGFLLGLGLAQPLSPEGVRRRLPAAAVVGVVGLAAVAIACFLLVRGRI